MHKISRVVAFSRLNFAKRIGMRWNKQYFILSALVFRLFPKLRQPIYCMGDSHIFVWNYVDKYVGSYVPKFVPFMVRGATALGLANPNSKTNAINEYNKMLSRLPGSSKVLFCLGEVDCGYLIWLISDREGLDSSVIFERALASYTSFLEQTALRGFSVIVAGAPMPTIGDGEPIGEVAILRAGVNATQMQRTEMTKQWNFALKLFCDTHKMTFINTDDFLLDPDTGLIRKVFVHPDPGNHHLDSHSYAAALLLAISETKAQDAY